MFRSVWARIAALFAATAVIATPLALTQGGGTVDVFVGSTPTAVGTPTATANIWVDTNGGTCTDNASPAAYSDAAACTPDAANDTCDNGDTVKVRTGTYSSGWDLTGSNSRTSACTLTTNGGAVTITDELNILGNWLTFAGDITAGQGTTTGASYDWNVPKYAVLVGNSDTQGVHDVTVRGLDGATFQVVAADNVTLDYSDYGPSVACRPAEYPSQQTENQVTGVSGSAGSAPDGFTLDHVLVHDQNTDNPSTCHTGGMVFQGGTNVVISNTRWFKNTIYDVIWDDFTATFDTSGYRIENNWFGCPVQTLDVDPTGSNVNDGSADLQIKWNGLAASDWLIRFNSFCHGVDAAWDGNPSSWTSWRLIGNTGGSIYTSASGPYNACRGQASGVTIKYNAWVRIDNAGTGSNAAVQCGDATNVALGQVTSYGLAATFPFASTSITTLNMCLKGAAGSTSADNLVTPTTTDYSLSLDINGVSRTSGSRDAGSCER